MIQGMAVEASQRKPRPEITLRVTCRHCGRRQTRRGSVGIYWTCKYPQCRGLNPGPKMEEALVAQPPHRPRDRRRQTPAAAGAQATRPDATEPGVAPEARSSTGPHSVPAAAPVRRRTRRTEAAAAAGGAGESPSPAPAPAARRRGPTSSSAAAPQPNPPTSPPAQGGGWRRWVVGEEG